MGAFSKKEWTSFLEEINLPDKQIGIENMRKQLICNDEKPKIKSYKAKIINYNLCPECKIECKSREGIIYCEGCGHQRPLMRENSHYSTSINQTHNTAVNSFMSFKLVGEGCYTKHRNLMKTCSDSAAYTTNKNFSEMMNYNYQKKGNKFPKDALKKAHDILCQIKKAGYVFRGNGKYGIWGACIGVACKANRTTKSRKAICDLLKIDQKFLSKGERTLQELEEDGIITLPKAKENNSKNTLSLEDYIIQYFSALEIDIKYKKFIIDIINRAEYKKLHMKHDSQLTTKCVGSIYMLCTRIKSLNRITKDMIWKESGISKSTFTRYYKLLYQNHKKVRKIFKKHRIPMPNEWKNNI